MAIARAEHSSFEENQEKIKLNKQLPLIGNIVEILEMNPDDEAEEEDGSTIDVDSQRTGKCVMLKTFTGQTMFLPLVGLVGPDKLKDLVWVDKHSFSNITLPDYDSQVKAMELDEKPTEDDRDIDDLEKQIQKLNEAIVYPTTDKERLQKLGLSPPKGVHLYEPPGTGKS